jgi:hypothetical protein
MVGTERRRAVRAASTTLGEFPEVDKILADVTAALGK